VIHEDLLLRNSTFFATELNGNWLESTKKQVCLPEDEPPVFAIWVTWLYDRQLPRLPWTVVDEASWIQESDLLSRAYMLGEKLDDKDFMDATIDLLIEVCVNGSWLSNHSTNNIFESSLPGSYLRTLYIL